MPIIVDNSHCALGVLIVLSPAFEILHSKFDRHIGHYRRYTKAHLRDIAPAALTCVKLIYFDAVGMNLSLANRLLIDTVTPPRYALRRQGMPPRKRRHRQPAGFPRRQYTGGVLGRLAPTSKSPDVFP